MPGYILNRMKISRIDFFTRSRWEVRSSKRGCEEKRVRRDFIPTGSEPSVTKNASEKPQRDFIPRNLRDGAEFSPRRPFEMTVGGANRLMMRHGCAVEAWAAEIRRKRHNLKAEEKGEM
jgi:hypothetical protein